jgi:hypothetical protein
MPYRRALVLVSAAQLGCGVAGLRIAFARKYAYDTPLLRGDPDRIARDAVPMGTALSAPAPMLVGQAVATGLLATGPNRRATRALAALGALMVPGYLGERLVRHRLTPAGWDRVESPLAAAGLGLAAAMAALGSRHGCPSHATRDE